MLADKLLNFDRESLYKYLQDLYTTSLARTKLRLCLVAQRLSWHFACLFALDCVENIKRAPFIAPYFKHLYNYESLTKSKIKCFNSLHNCM